MSGQKSPLALRASSRGEHSLVRICGPPEPGNLRVMLHSREQAATSGSERVAPGETESAAPGGELDRLYELHGPAVERWVRRLAGPAAEVEDLIHDVFVVALRRRSEFRGEAKLSTWLFGITQNLVRKRRWRERVRAFWTGQTRYSFGTEIAEASSPLDDVDRADKVRRLYRALDRLPEAQRTALILSDIDQLSAREVSLLLGLQENAVWVRVHRARARLRRELERAERQGGGGRRP